MFIKSNVGLGHGELVYLMQLKNGKYLVLNSIGDYISGSIIVVDKYWKNDIRQVLKAEAEENCDVNWELIKHLLLVDREYPQYVVAFTESEAGMGGEVWYRTFDSEELARAEVHDTNKDLPEQTPKYYIKAEYLGLLDKVPEGYKF